MYTVIWGVALLAGCTARLIGAYPLSVTTMAWLGGVLTMSKIGLAIVVGGVAAGPVLHSSRHGFRFCSRRDRRADQNDQVNDAQASS